MPKKTKARKVTDVRGNKPWLTKAEASTYKETREANKLILITCEGQTEKLYFESFPVLTLKVHAIDLKGESKLKLIESTNEVVNNTEIQYDEVWCVFDMDYRRGEKEFADFDNAIKKGKSLNFKIAYSNDAFELWFYLHYRFTIQKNHRSFYYQFLGDKWNLNYQDEGKKYKFCYGIYELLNNDELASQERAIKNAEKLYKEQSGLAYHEQNPVTLVYELVRLLRDNMRR